MAYVDYEYYSNTYKGSSIPETAFDAWEVQAEAFVDMITFNRINEESLTDEIKNAVCAVADKAQQLSEAGGIITSQTVGKVSVSYKIADNATTLGTLKHVASLFLADTGLLYRGW